MSDEYALAITESIAKEWCKRCDEELSRATSYPFEAFNWAAGILSLIVKKNHLRTLIRTKEFESFEKVLKEKLRMTELYEESQLTEEEANQVLVYSEQFKELFQLLKEERRKQPPVGSPTSAALPTSLLEPSSPESLVFRVL